MDGDSGALGDCHGVVVEGRVVWGRDQDGVSFV